MEIPKNKIKEVKTNCIDCKHSEQEHNHMVFCNVLGYCKLTTKTGCPVRLFEKK